MASAHRTKFEQVEQDAADGARRFALVVFAVITLPVTLPCWLVGRLARMVRRG